MGGGTVIFLPYLARNTGVFGVLLKITETLRGRLDSSQIELFRHLLPHSANIHGIFIIRSPALLSAANTKMSK